MKAVIYARYSSERQTEQSIEGQLRCCQEYADRCGYKIIGQYIDRAYSGTSAERPEFQRMIRDAEKKQFKYIIVWKLDRFARNRYDSAIFKQQLKRNGVKVISATEGVGAGDESAILEALLEAMAEEYSRQLAQNVTRGMRENALKGLTTGSNRIFGYKVDENKRYIIDDRNAMGVKMIFEMYANGNSKQEIADKLNKKAYRTAQGHRFTVNSFNTLLSNKKYIGIYSYTDKFGTIELPDAVPRLISDELFYRCQEKLKANKRQSGSFTAKVNYLLSGKLFCGKCGEPLIGDSGTGKNGIRRYYYTCRNKKKSACTKKREKKELIEFEIVDMVCKHVLQPDKLEKIAEKVADTHNKLFSNDTLEDMKKELKAIDKNLERVAQRFIETDSKELIKKLNEQAKDLEHRKLELEDEINNKAHFYKDRKLDKKDVIKYLKHFCSQNTTDPVYQERIIDTLVNSIYVYDDKLIIYINLKHDNQVSFIELQTDLEECSTVKLSGPPKKK